MDADETTTFADLGLRPELLAALASLGYEEPTPIQREAVPPLVAGRDLLGQAATGTGKTAAFALPLLQVMPAGDRAPHPTAMVLVPTRELAVQVSQALHRYGRELGARVLPIYGGQPIGRQLGALQRGVDVVVATPGRALDHLNRGTLRLDQLRTVVLDEADEMLDMGFADELEAILAATPDTRQTVLFSATLPKRIDGIARRHLRDPVRIEIEREQPAEGEAPKVRQSAYVVARAHKAAALGRILDIEAPTATIVFCRTRDEVDQLTETLNGRGYRAEALHGGMSQEQRDRVMGRLRAGTAELLVATDVAARGLDIDQLTHVVNYEVPSAPDAYVHRIGRVGRGGREGVAITLAEPREHRMLKTIERVTRQRIPVEKVPTTADLLAARLELTRAALHEVLLEDHLEPFRVVVETLTDDFDVMQVALAAVKLAHEATGVDLDQEEIPEVATGPVGGGTRRTPDGSPGRAGGGPQRGRAGPGVATTRIFVGGRPGGRHPAAGPGRCHRRRVQAVRPGHRRHRDQRPVLAGGGARGRGHRGGRRAAADPDQGQEGAGAPRPERFASLSPPGPRRQATRRAPEGGSRRTAGAFPARPPRIGRGSDRSVVVGAHRRPDERGQSTVGIDEHGRHGTAVRHVQPDPELGVAVRDGQRLERGDRDGRQDAAAVQAGGDRRYGVVLGPVGPQDLETFQSNVHPAAGAHPDLAAVDHPRCAARFRAGHGRGIPRSARHQHAVDEVCAVITAIMGERDARADDQGERGEGSHQGETAVQTHDGDLQEGPGRCPCDGSTAGRAGPFTVSAGRFRRRGERIGAGRRTPGQRTGRHRAVSSQAQ